MPPDGYEHSELDDALFGALPDAPADRVQPRPSGAGDDANLDAALFGDEALEPTAAFAAAPTRASRRAARTRGWRIALGAFAVLLVLGVGGAAYALLGTGNDTTSKSPKIEVRGTSVTTVTTTVATTTTVAPTTVPVPAAPTVPPTAPPTPPRTVPQTVPQTEPPTEPTTVPATVPTTTPPTTEPPTTVPPTTTTFKFPKVPGN